MIIAAIDLLQGTEIQISHPVESDETLEQIFHHFGVGEQVLLDHTPSKASASVRATALSRTDLEKIASDCRSLPERVK